MSRKLSLIGAVLLGLCGGAQATKPLPWVDAEVKKVPPEQGKVTLKHGPLDNLDMPGMTMTFRTSDPALLAGVSVGDKVRVVVMKLDGYYMVTGLEKATAP